MHVHNSACMACVFGVSTSRSMQPRAPIKHPMQSNSCIESDALATVMPKIVGNLVYPTRMCCSESLQAVPSHACLLNGPGPPPPSLAAAARKYMCGGGSSAICHFLQVGERTMSRTVTYGRTKHYAPSLLPMHAGHSCTSGCMHAVVPVPKDRHDASWKKT
jgi:hypothetical protein